MENNDNKQESTIKNFWNRISGYVILNAFLIMKIAIGILSIFITLFLLEKFFPRMVHLMNYAITEKTVTKMISGHHYNEAIYLLEHKENLTAKSKNFHELRYPLYDCYSKVGEFMKAEREIRIIEDSSEAKLKREASKDISNTAEWCFLQMTLKRDRLKIYEKIGDVGKIQSITKEIASLYSIVDTADFSMIDDEDWPVELSLHELNESVRFDIIKAEYYTNRQKAMDSLNSQISSLYHLKKYNERFKLRLMNQMLKWLIENHQTIRARYVLEMALQLTDQMPKIKDLYEPLGELSEYCRILHDTENARRMLEYYNLYIKETCTDDDMEYYLSKAHFFKILQHEGKTDKLEDMVCECCDGIKKHILNNLAGMTSQQREYFVEITRAPFGEAEKLLSIRESPKLKKICFENKCFEKGLLLRSSLAVDNAVKALGDTTLSQNYQKYIQLRRELTTRQYITGPGNFVRKKELESEISDLESLISEKSEDFRRAQNCNYTLDQIKGMLDENEAVVLFSDNGQQISAYIVTSKQGLVYQEISSRKDFDKALREYKNIYANESLTHLIWDKIAEVISNSETIYYIPDGVLCNISIGALPLEGDSVLDDKANLCQLSSPMNIEQAKSQEDILLTDSEISLWGGIFYSEGDSIFAPNDNTPIQRGKELRYLPGSLSEVLGIRDILESMNIRTNTYTSQSATENSFLQRSGKKDRILHISTHAFFQENKLNSLNYNPMHNCGLFFYNSNRFWTNDSTSTTSSSDDGILRSEEIEVCDFSHCRLAVLSACETGKGQTTSPEGIYGLQRAFKLAGVDMILMSLWNVDDATTRDLMISFYRHLAVCKNPSQALRSAKSEIRSQGKDTYYWGGFVVVR